MLAIREIQIKISYVKQKNFEFANKPGKLVAYKLWIEKENNIETSRERYCIKCGHAKNISSILF